jgi:hypothetical protein
VLFFDGAASNAPARDRCGSTGESTAFKILIPQGTAILRPPKLNMPGFHNNGAPRAFTYRAYRDWLAVMNSRLRLIPPKHRLAQASGR